MSWKTDKFQALRDRAQNTKVGQALIEAARARTAEIQAVTASLRPEPKTVFDDRMDAMLYGVLSSRAGKAWGASLAQAAMRPSYFDKLTGKTACVAILDDVTEGTITLDKLQRAKAVLGANSSARAIEALQADTRALIRQQMEAYRAQVGEAKTVAEITRELRGEPEPTPEYDRPMRFSYGFDYSVKRDQSVVAVCGV